MFPFITSIGQFLADLNLHSDPACQDQEKLKNSDLRSFWLVETWVLLVSNIYDMTWAETDTFEQVMISITQYIIISPMLLGMISYILKDKIMRCTLFVFKSTKILLPLGQGKVLNFHVFLVFTVFIVSNSPT